MKSKIWLSTGLVFLLGGAPGFGLDKMTIPCEVMESSEATTTASGRLNGVRYLLIHHAHSEDRPRISKWLKAYSGTEVQFFVGGRAYEGVLYRLAHCFGRGLLIYKADIRPEKRDIIQVILPLPKPP